MPYKPLQKGETMKTIIIILIGLLLLAGCSSSSEPKLNVGEKYCESKYMDYLNHSYKTRGFGLQAIIEIDCLENGNIKRFSYDRDNGTILEEVKK